MQLLGLTVALVRLGLIAAACLIFVDARVVLAAGTVAFAVQAWALRRWVRTSIEWGAPKSAEYRARILAIVKKQAPLTMFHCVQGQLTVFLASIFASKESVADIGALGRFSVLFTLISSVVSGIVVPRFARCQEIGRAHV